MNKTALSGKYAAYAEYKDTEIEWLGEIPVDWSMTKMAWNFNAEKGKNGQLLTKDYCGLNSGEYVVYSGQTENHGIMGRINSFEFDTGESGVLFSTTVGAKAMHLSHLTGKFSLSQNCMIIIPKSQNYHVRFSFYHFQPLFAYERGLIPEHMQASFRVEDLNQYQTAIPSIEEQEKIASFLDYETAKIDTLIEKQQQLIKLLKEKRQAVISHAVTKGLNPNASMRDSGVEWLGEVPAHWDNTKIKYITDLTPKKSEVENNKEQSCHFIPMEKLKTDVLVLDETRKIKEVFDGYTYFKDEDVLMAKVTPCFENRNTVVARGLENGIGFGSTEIFVLRPKLNLLNDFLYYRLQEDVFIEIATGNMTGAGGLKRVPSDFINNFEIALPPEQERVAIVKHIRIYAKKFDTLISKAEGAIGLMTERRTALISAAVTGKIDVRHFTSKKGQAPKSSDQEVINVG